MDRFLLLADVHGNLRALKKAVQSVPDADYIVIAGDLPLTTPLSTILTFALFSKSLNRNRYSKWVYGANRKKFVAKQRNSVKKMLLFLEECGKEVLYVSGNVDCSETEELYSNKERFHVINNRCIKVGDYWWAGIPGSLVHIDQGTCDREISEKQMADQCSTLLRVAAGKKKLILVTHEPPRFTGMDKVSLHSKKLYDYQFKCTGGSEHVTGLIDQLQPDFVVNGHYHEYPGLREVHGKPVINPGCLANYRFALLYKDKEGKKNIKTVFRKMDQRGFDFINWIYSQRAV